MSNAADTPKPPRSSKVQSAASSLVIPSASSVLGLKFRLISYNNSAIADLISVNILGEDAMIIISSTYLA